MIVEKLKREQFPLEAAIAEAAKEKLLHLRIEIEVLRVKRQVIDARIQHANDAIEHLRQAQECIKKTI